MPLKKDISAFAVLILQMLFERVVGEMDVSRSLFSACSVTGTIGNFCCGIWKAPPLVDTCIVPGGAVCLYALFEWGLTDEQTVLIDLEPHQSNSNLDSNIDLYQPLEVNNPYSFSTSSTSCSNWTKTRFPGMNLGYCTIYTEYGGNATYSTMRKSNVLRNKDYEDFILNVNKLRDRESAIIGSVSVVEFAKYLMKKKPSQWTLAIIKEALKKAALPLTLGYTMFMWIWQYDKTLKKYYRLKTR
jgi:hypothetical protein